VKRTPLQRRTRLKPMSDRRRAEHDASRPVVRAVFERDGGCVLARYVGPATVPACFGALTPHHLRKKSALGEWTRRNLVTLCSSHNNWVECQPALARELGLVIRDGDTEHGAWLRLGEALGIHP
jgi:hypothetical protein